MRTPYFTHKSCRLRFCLGNEVSRVVDKITFFAKPTTPLHAFYFTITCPFCQRFPLPFAFLIDKKNFGAYNKEEPTEKHIGGSNEEKRHKHKTDTVLRRPHCHRHRSLRYALPTG
jgi:hypothetical protein